jgi:hypothetical protein
VPAQAAHAVASEPPIGSLFSAFLGYNPIKQLLGPTGVLQKLPPRQAAYITGRSFFPHLIEEPFAGGLHLAFTFAAIATLIAIIASALRGKRYVHESATGAGPAVEDTAAWETAPVAAEAPVDVLTGEMVTYPVDAELAYDAELAGDAQAVREAR